MRTVLLLFENVERLDAFYVTDFLSDIVKLFTVYTITYQALSHK